MCGIFGWQFRPNYRPPFWKRALLANALGRENLSRGKDSWGWYLMDTHEIAKGVGEMTGHTHHAAPQFCAFGHTRHGTVGAKTYDNAHPFTIGNIIGAHNGGIASHDSLNSKRKEAGLPEFEVDSMHLIDAISRGLSTAGDLTGWGAVEWVNMKEPKTIRLAKINFGGDLSVAQCPEGIIWSSSEYDLKRAMADAGFHGIFLKIEEKLVHAVHNGVIKLTGEKLELNDRTGYNGGYQGNFQSQGYGSQGVLLATAREEYIERMRKEREEKKGKKSKKIKRGEKIHDARAGDAEILMNGDLCCTKCYAKCNESGKCPEGHNASTVVVNV